MGLVYLKSLSYLGGMNKTVDPHITYYTPYSSLGLATKKFIADRTLVWCEQHLPLHHCGFPPDYKFRHTDVGRSANYSSDYHTITLSTTEIKDVKDMIRCILHEWCHSFQDLSSYDLHKADDPKYYWNHPLEKAARRCEVVWYAVWTQLKHELGVPPTPSESLVLNLNKFYREILGF